MRYVPPLVPSVNHSPPEVVPSYPVRTTPFLNGVRMNAYPCFSGFVFISTTMDVPDCVPSVTQTWSRSP